MPRSALAKREFQKLFLVAKGYSNILHLAKAKRKNKSIAWLRRVIYIYWLLANHNFMEFSNNHQEILVIAYVPFSCEVSQTE